MSWFKQRGRGRPQSHISLQCVITWARFAVLPTYGQADWRHMRACPAAKRAACWPQHRHRLATVTLLACLSSSAARAAATLLVRLSSSAAWADAGPCGAWLLLLVRGAGAAPGGRGPCHKDTRWSWKGRVSSSCCVCHSREKPTTQATAMKPHTAMTTMTVSLWRITAGAWLRLSLRGIWMTTLLVVRRMLALMLPAACRHGAAVRGRLQVVQATISDFMFDPLQRTCGRQCAHWRPEQTQPNT